MSSSIVNNGLRFFSGSKPQAGKVHPSWDSGLIEAVTVLVCLGLVMVFSASIGVAERNANMPNYYYLLRQCIFISISVLVGLVVAQVPMVVWHKLSGPLLALSLLGLIAVLIPGIGSKINGSWRWINLGFFNVQPSEIAKLFMVVYAASFVTARQKAGSFSGADMLAPMIVLVMIAVLLLLEPDLGSAMVLGATVLGMLFLGGIRLIPFLSVTALMVVSGSAAVYTSSYRMDRVMLLLDPWQDPFGKGYQLVQALIAFGQGGLTGVGLGSSVQKLSYLPESHTDFLMAILAEELGLFAVVGVLGLFLYISVKGFAIAASAMKNGFCFNAMVAYGVTLLFSIQALINIGVNMGVLPTTGLTLPLMSYGGSSLIMNAVAFAMLLRIDHENRAMRRKVRS